MKMNKTENKLTLLATPLGINNLNYSREVARSEVARLTDKKYYKNSSSSLKIKLSEKAWRMSASEPWFASADAPLKNINGLVATSANLKWQKKKNQ